MMFTVKFLNDSLAECLCHLFTQKLLLYAARQVLTRQILMRSPWHQTRPDENTVQFSSNDLLSDDIDVCNICHQTKIQLFSGASQLYTFCRHDCTLIVSEKTLNKLSETGQQTINTVVNNFSV